MLDINNLGIIELSHSAVCWSNVSIPVSKISLWNKNVHASDEDLKLKIVMILDEQLLIYLLIYLIYLSKA